MSVPLEAANKRFVGSTGLSTKYDSRRKSEMVHVVICDENWVEVDKTGY